MNRIFKTVWNVARKALVVVNEKAGIGQSRCTAVGTGSEVSTSSVTVEHKKSFGVPSGLVMALAGVFVFWGGNVEAAKTFPTDCASVGGTMKDGVCYIGDGTQTKGPIVDVVNAEWNLTAGDMIVAGGGRRGMSIQYNASEGGKSSITNKGEGTLTIKGGNKTLAVGILYNAYGQGSVGTIANSSAGTIRIVGGSDQDAIDCNGNGGGKGIITNLGVGEMIIVGSDSSNNSGLQTNAFQGTGEISNKGLGKLTISGGGGDKSVGIYTNGFWDATGTIVNAGLGELIISGGTGKEAHGLFQNASNGTGLILNDGNGTLSLVGGNGEGANAVNYNSAGGSVGAIRNKKGGVLNILGNSVSGSFGINVLAFSEDSESYLENAGIMNLNENAINKFSDGSANQVISVINRSTGTVNAEAEAIFTKSETNTFGPIKIEIVSANGQGQTVQIDSFQETGSVLSWALKADWANYSVWEDGGKLVITDVMAGSTSAQQITAAFQEKFGTGTSIIFLGENDDASEGASPKFTASIANDLISQGFAGAVVTNFDLDVSSDEGTAQHVTIGQSGTNSITDSIGFRQILGASAVSVRGGKTLTLIGTIEGEELVEGGGTVDLHNGRLQLGVDAGSEETTGFLSDVSIVNDSKVTAENGWFRMDSLTGTGEVSVAENGRVYAGEMTVTGSVKNAGTLSADSLNVKGNLESSKTLKTSGTITVDAGSKLSVNGAVVADSIKADGVVVLGSNAQVYTGAAAMDQLRKQNAEAAAEIDRVEGKAEVNTMSVLDRIVAESMKKMESEETDSNQEKAEESSSGSSSTGTVITSHLRAAPVLPQDAQAFAAFDAVKRIASDIERGTNPDGHGLWVKLQTNESEFGARAGTKFEVDSDGAVVGAEAKLNPSVKVGGAVSYLDGEIDAGAGKTNWTSYGLHGYVQFKEGAFGVKGTAGWLRGTTEAAEDYDADVWHAGVRAEYDLPAGSMTFTPFVGARVMSGSFDGLDSQTTFSLPVGVALSGTLTTGGWTIVPSFEAAYVRSMGDTEAEDVRILAKDTLEGTLSLKATKGAWTGELSYRRATGGRDYEDRAFMAKIGMTF